MKPNRLCCVFCWITGLIVTAAIAGMARGAESLPEGLQVVGLTAFPERVELTGRFQYRQLLLSGRLATGETVDLTRMATLVGSPKVVSVSPTCQVRPLASGEEQLVFQFGQHSVSVPVKVVQAAEQTPVSFVRDVQPLLARMGCNQGTCHGAKDGKAGFKLSLRGYDPLFDHQALTDEIGARRFNRANPDQSLMLLKATGSIPHVGGVRTKFGDPYYNVVRAWIAGGAKLDLDASRVVSIDVSPKNPIVPRAGMKQQMSVLATYSDGTVRDVSREAFIESGNIEVIESLPDSPLTMLRRGEAAVLVRYEGAYTATRLTVMGDRSGFVWQTPPTNNYVDELVYKKLERAKILSSELCIDEEFLRRVHLDLTGLPPDIADVRAFLADGRDTRTKRDELIDRLVGSRPYVEHWTNKWADLMQVNRKFLGEEGAVALRNWIKQSIATNKPYDQFAREVLTATGSTLENPPAAYFKVLPEPAETMENTTHLFLAIRFNCNKCHDHPFERWTQDQYYHLAAYFAQVGRKPDPTFAGKTVGGSAVEGAKPLVEVVFDRDSGEVRHDRTGQNAPPKFPFDLVGASASAQGPRRQQLAQWLTSANNPYFARSYVNRLWGYLFGIGIIEPIDDIRAGNPATNPELLDALSADFVRSGFDVQSVLKTICKSRVYQHSFKTNRWNEDDDINYSHALPRRLPAEALYDAIHIATGSTPRLPGVPAGFRAAELLDSGQKVDFLDDFGRPPRESACECERTGGVVLGPVMKLINGPTVADAINDPANALTKLVASQPDDEKLIEEVFLRFLARRPNAEETKLGIAALKASESEHERAVSDLRAYEAGLAARQAAWEKSANQPVEWTIVEPSESKSQVGATFTKQDDKSLLVGGPNGKDVYTLTLPTDLTGITGVRIEALPHPTFKAGGSGRAPDGNFVLSEIKLSAAPKSDPSKVAAIPLTSAASDFNQDGWNVAGAIDGNDATGWAISPRFNQPHEAYFETGQDVGVAGGTLLTVTLSQQFPSGEHSLGRFRLSITTAKRPLSPNRLPAEIAAVLAVPADQRSAEQKAQLVNYFRALDGQLARLNNKVQRAAAQLKNQRLIGVQDLAWALINNPAFLFNR